MSEMPEGTREAMELVRLTYPDLFKPMVKQLGSNLGTMAEYLSQPLILRMKYATIEKKLRFKKRIQKLFKEYGEIPPEDICEIPSTIGHQAFDHLAIESDEYISDLFIQLLRTSASAKTIHLVHPSFITCIKNISGDEAKLLFQLSTMLTIPFLKIRMNFTKTEWLLKTSFLTGLEKKSELIYPDPDYVQLYIENFIGLGILIPEEGSLSDTDKWYKSLMEFYEPLRQEIYNKGHADGKQYEVVFLMGFLKITSYGRQFMEACLKKVEK